ncbi:MATE family efflux transporter [Marinomonas agarivorans]|nr:MATE family efflux transporter [Marinomonas agarivorans]
MASNAIFTQQSTLKHVVVTAITGALGLLSIFMVDLVDILFLSMLDQKEVVAAVGFASSIMFFMISLSLAISITGVALISQALGRGDHALAKQRAVNILVFGFLVSLLIVWLMAPNLPYLLLFLGAAGRTLDLATSYLQITLYSIPALMIGIVASGIIRAVGDAKRAMYATLVSGLVNAVLDPIFIFVLDLGLDGAALASLCARFSMLIIAYHGVVRVHNMLGKFDWLYFGQDLKCIFLLFFPTMLANLSSPLANAIATEHMSAFGDDAVAAYAIIGRIIPVIFAGLFSLSSAIGPILGQNYGAKDFVRIKRTLGSAVFYSFIYSLLTCWLVYELQDWLIALFNASGRVADLIHFFTTYITFSFFFQSFLFIAFAVFNNLGQPSVSAWLNFGRATLGTWPFIVVFGWLFAAKGVLVGLAFGSITFGCIGLLLAKRYIDRLALSNS